MKELNKMITIDDYYFYEFLNLFTSLTKTPTSTPKFINKLSNT